MQTSDYRWRLDTRLLVWCLATRLCDRLLNVNSSGEWSSHSSFYFVAQPFFRSNSLVEEGSRSCFWSSFVKGNRCRKIWCKKSAEKSFSEHILALSIIDHRYRYIDHVWSRSHMYQSHSFCLVNVHSFSQWYTMDCPLWKFLKSFSDIWNFIGNERWMYYMYFYTYLSSFLSFLYLYVCLSRKGF